jgi:UDP:flavonoid glycosyltransferase YjiC (YdhE family)
MDFAAREDVRARAKRLGAEMEKDDGLRVAVAAIEEIARR